MHAECGVRPEDVIISVMANRHVDWSFGLGQAQFLDGTLRSLEQASKAEAPAYDYLSVQTIDTGQPGK